MIKLKTIFPRTYDHDIKSGGGAIEYHGEILLKGKHLTRYGFHPGGLCRVFLDHDIIIIKPV